ncbi:hypothetical protein [Kurthia gibsonii]|uniref:hypothetical protein n=1 Tax=Kurthia gibsonii TaxID=33946 RepID=UPI001141E0E1|nr:hypothetical protein [Kurthia gibsonii]
MRKTNKRPSQKSNRSLIAMLLISLFIISAFIVNKAVEGKQVPLVTTANTKGSYLVATEGLDYARLEIKQQMIQIYQDVQKRYERLSPSEKAAFDVKKITLYKIQTLLNRKSGIPKTWDTHQKVDDIQPISTTLIIKDSKPNQYTIQSTGRIGGEQTKLKQPLQLDLEMDTTMRQGRYEPPYAIHASKEIVVQNASKVWGLMASKNPRNIQIDGSSCQYELTGTSFLNECFNDGNTEASDLKIWNEQNFNNFLPIFPMNELKTIDEQPYNEEEKYVTEIIPNPDPEKKDKKINYYYLQNSTMTVTDKTQEDFSIDTPYQFTSSEERLQELTLDGVDAYIDIGDGVQTLRLDTLNLNGGAKLHILGSGTLKLFIQEMGESEGEIVAEEAKIATYFDGDATLEFSQNFRSSGFIYSKKADITLRTNTYKGNILSGGKRVVINGGKSNTGKLLLAPKANIELKDKTNFKGSILGQAIVVTDSTVQHKPLKDNVNIPIQYAVYDKPKHFALYGQIKQFE